MANHPFRLISTTTLIPVGLIVTFLLTLLLRHPVYASDSLAEHAAPVSVVDQVLFVDRAAAGATHDGLSWETAYPTLQDALAVAQAGQEIWVAAGIYYPDEGLGSSNNDPNATFLLRNGVALYGGFTGTEESRDARDWRLNRTVLSGDLAQDDPNKNSDGISTIPSTMVGPNAYQVVKAVNAGAQTILDGFIITGGRAFGDFTNPCGLACGGGIYLDTSTPRLRNLVLSGNYANFYGAALTAVESTLLLEDSLIQGNRSENYGGALFTRQSGGQLLNVVISGNRSGGRGGGLYSFLSAEPLKLTNVTFSGNRALNAGGAIYNAQSIVYLENSIVWNNKANDTSEINNGMAATTIYNASLIKDAFTGLLWNIVLGINGGKNVASDPRFVVEIDPNTAPTLDGDLRLQALSPAADGGNARYNSSLFDLSGLDRRQGATIDMGAYESSYKAELAIGQQVTPPVIEYGEPITYTIVLTNSGNALAYNTQITNSLPTTVNFTRWLQQPDGAIYRDEDRTIAWTGDVAAATVTTFQFVGTHQGGPDETIINTASYEHLINAGAAAASFAVLPLPLVDIADVTVDEAEGRATFAVTLSATTRKPVVLDYIASDDTALFTADYTDSSGTLTIAPGALGGVINIPINQDFIDEEDEQFTVTLRAADNGTLADATATATILDDDTAGTQVTPLLLTIDEPVGKATFTITADSQPVQPVLITLRNSDPSECSIPATVILDEQNWQQGVGVDVQAVDDFVVDGAQECLVEMSTTSDDPNYHNLVLTAVTVVVHSDDVAGIGVTPPTLAIGELDEVGLFTITLTSEPTATVTIDLASNDEGECRVPARVTLGPDNWQRGVTLPVTAQNDDLDDGDQICLIRTTVTSVDANYAGRVMSDLSVTVVDDDQAGVAVAPATLTINEPSGQATFGLSLTSEPLAPVTINLTSQDTSECVVPKSVTLDRNNWNVLITVPVTAVDDLIDDADQPCLIQTDVISSDPKYQGVAADDIAVTVQDDGDSAAVLLSKTVLVVNEPNTTDTFVIRLNSQPVSSVTIKLASQNRNECTVTDSVTLDATNWQQGKSVTVQAVDDERIDGTQSCLIQTTVTSNDAPYHGIAVVDPVADVKDNDYADLFVGSPELVVSEPNGSTIMILKLTSIPEAPVTVALASRDLTECNVPAAVTLNSSNWKVGVGVSLFAINDDVDDDDQRCDVQATLLSADPHYNGLAVDDFPVTVIDDDEAGTRFSPAALTIGEPAESATFAVALTSEPTAAVTVTFASADPGECIVSEDVTLDATNWRGGVVVPVTAVDDYIDDEAQRCQIQPSLVSNDPKYQAMTSAALPVTVEDDEIASVLVTPQKLTIGEPNGRTTFSITLTSEPTATVTVNLQSRDLSECRVPDSVTLDATNWAIGVAVPVQAVDDRIDDANQLCTVETSVTSVDGDYAGIDASDVDVTVQDDGDHAGILLSSTALTVSEPAGSAGFTITLNSEPVAPVTIDFVPDDPGECSATAVLLDATNWALGAMVLTHAVDDHVDDGSQLCTLQGVVRSDDPLYEKMAIANIALTVEDEDAAGILQSQVAMTIAEPDTSAFYTISLTSEPVAAVNVALTTSDPTECRVPDSVTLDATNWRAGVTVPVTAVDDHQMDGGQPCVVESLITSADPLYQGLRLAPVVAMTADDDVAGFAITASTETIHEVAGEAIFTVTLTSEPTATVTLSLVSLDQGECGAPESVVIEPAQWQTGALIALRGVRDDIDDGAQPCIVTGIANSVDVNYDKLSMDDLTLTIADSNLVEMAATFEASSATAEIGDVVTYTYQVTNTGMVTLTVQALDSLFGEVSFAQPLLAPKERAIGRLTRVVQEHDLPGPLAHLATLTGHSPTGRIISKTVTTTVQVAANPQLRVDVTRVGPPIVVPGTVVTYQVEIANVGHVDANVLAIHGTPSELLQAASVDEADCTTPLTIVAGQSHSCILLWKATVNERDTIHYVVTVDAIGLLDFAKSASGGDIVVVSSPTSIRPERIYLPVVNR